MQNQLPEPCLSFAAELNLTLEENEALRRCLEGRDPAPWHLMASFGHRSLLAQRYAKAWINYRTPLGYLQTSTFVGARLLLDTAHLHRLPYQGTPIEPLLQERTPVRYIRCKLLSDLLRAAALVPWPTMRAPFPSLLVLLPQDGMRAPVTNRDEPEAVAALVVHARDRASGLELSWDAYGWGGAWWHDGWSVRPMVDIPLSRLAWAIAGLLQGAEGGLASDARGVAAGAPAEGADEPATPWLRPAGAATSGGGHRRSAAAIRTPHWRRAHPHRFWTGRRQGERKLVTRWLPAVWVAGEEGA